MSADISRGEHDAQLCRRAQAGDVSSANLLIAEYLPFVRRMVFRCRSAAAETDDLLQEGLIGLFNAVLAYDETRGAAFSSFAYRCVLNRLLSALADAVSVPTEEELAALLAKIPEPEDPQEILQKREDAARWMEEAEKCLSKFEQRVLQLHLKGATYREIAARLQTTEKSVDNAMQRVRRKLRVQAR